VVMEWMATITGDHVGYPGFRDLGDFSPKRRKILGSKNSHVFRHQIFAVESGALVVFAEGQVPYSQPFIFIITYEQAQ
jgi:hypothetical protein